MIDTRRSLIKALKNGSSIIKTVRHLKYDELVAKESVTILIDTEVRETNTMQTNQIMDIISFTCRLLCG